MELLPLPPTRTVDIYVGEGQKIRRKLLLHSPSQPLVSSSLLSREGSLYPVPSSSYTFPVAWKIIVFQAFHDFCACTHIHTHNHNPHRHALNTEASSVLQRCSKLTNHCRRCKRSAHCGHPYISNKPSTNHKQQF